MDNSEEDINHSSVLPLQESDSMFICGIFVLMHSV